MPYAKAIHFRIGFTQGCIGFFWVVQQAFGSFLVLEYHQMSERDEVGFEFGNSPDEIRHFCHIVAFERPRDCELRAP
ncbi:hypothetical protein ASC83_12240 [Acidovorax sp. Root402]|nr:hypothetical protein ASC83_12240 [Acidovorax sp. Root402]